MLKQRFAAILTAVGLAATLCTPTLAAGGSFWDVPPGYWAADYIQTLSEKELINGVGNGRFAPEETVSNASFVVMAMRPFLPALGLEADELEDGGSWYQGYLDSARELGLLSSCTFTDAQGPMSRYDMACFTAALGRQVGLTAPAGAGGAGLADYATMPSERRQAVDYTCALGLLTGYSDGAFHGEDSMTRAQAAAVLCRLMDAVPGQPGTVTVESNSDNTSASIHCTPSTKLWTGQQGRAWAFQVSSQADMAACIAQAMDSYPTTLIFFSATPLEYNPLELLAPYEITHGLHNRIKAICYNSYVFSPEDTGGNYYEYRLDLHYSAAGIVRMYREGVLDTLPDTKDMLWPEEAADYTLLLQAVEEVEDTYGLTAASSDYDKALAAYRYLTENCTYDYYMMSQSGNDLVHMFDSVLYPDEINYMLTYHKGVCFEYALTYQALCYVLGLDCYVVTGNAGGAHAWNIVQVDGQWYQADPTWDAGNSTYRYFLVSDQTMSSRTVDQGYYNYPACPYDYAG